MLERSGLFAESWNAAFRKKGTGEILTDKKTPFTVIKNSPLYWAADPFLFENEGQVYIFAELYDYIHCRGTLGYCKVEEGKKCKWKQIILEDYHMSYPCINRVGDDFYIMPESGGDKSLYVYKAVSFPDKWEKSTVLRSDVVYGDTTPLTLNGHKYAFTYDVKDEYKLIKIDLENKEEDQLITGENTNVQRPAGKFFYKDGKLMRPAQICENDYGEGLTFYEVSADENMHMTEKRIDNIYPTDIVLDKKMILDGMHTYNSIENYEVIDIKTRRFNLINLVFRFLNKLRK